MKCIICKLNDTEGRNNYCASCFSMAIDELDRKYGKGKGPSIPAKESREALASNPLTEKPTTPQAIIKLNGGQGGMMDGPLQITKEQILMIVHNLETLAEIFMEKQLLFNQLERMRFLEAKNRIHSILAEIYERR